VATLPETGVLLCSTDLQGNFKDYIRLKHLYFQEKEAGNNPVLAICGDLVHGPSPEFNEPGCWPDYLGTPYVDESVALIQDFDVFTRSEQAFSLIGNHEHAHVGGPVVAKFYEDEAAVLEAALGSDHPRVCDFMREFPLLAVGSCGVVLTHGAPFATEPHLEDFENLRYAGYEEVAIEEMIYQDPLAALLWARHASPAQARHLLEVAFADENPQGFVAFGHDVVFEGYETIGNEQICVSTSFGLENRNKVYLRLDLSHRYTGVQDLREGVEIRKLYP